jgi:hypothetical protein
VAETEERADVADKSATDRSRKSGEMSHRPDLSLREPALPMLRQSFHSVTDLSSDEQSNVENAASAR